MTAPTTGEPRDPGGVLHEVESLLAAGDYRRAEEIVRAALATDPHNPWLLTAYARVKIGRSDWTTAAASAHAALAVDPDNEHTMRVYTRALEMLGRLQDARWMAGRTVATHPSSHQAHYAHARLLAATGRTAEAMAVVNEALRLNPSDVDSLVLRGNIFATLKQYQPAETDYRAALHLNPADADAVHGFALLDHARGGTWSAVRGLLAAERLDPAYRDMVRQNVGAILGGVLRKSAWVVLIVGFAVIVAFTLHEDGHPTVTPRIVAGVGAVMLVVMFARVVRGIPTGTIGSVLRERQMLVIRIGQLVGGVVLGAVTAALGAMTLPSVLASLLVLSLPVVMIVGYFTDERLW
ncbi:tetratricopeptide repeat protein [Mycolicibacterium baixiangningiae]|uniref:tetratricopeptide repeat protein n=1 Tax=Mycolicibacterium baixiangningiae TaxID=2761578 RepID=UPI0018D1D27B|nr:tetratricopeptide repeat protein [Mycolicibacterium baixiangningiae]